MVTDDTIIAIATPPGRGGVGVVRVSGPESLSIAKQITDRKNITPRQVIYCSFYDKQDELIDQGILLYFRAPHSFTGEDVVEFQAHGSPIVLDRIIDCAASYGARLARPGEFSQRAFLNDKIDLTQAEAIADLINASSATAARMAVRSLQGEFSAKINALNEELIHLRLYVEAAIDFPEEEIDFLNDGKVLGLLKQIIEKLHDIHEGARQGAMLREGLSVVIAGRPNAGKSTLINALAGKEVAIVTELAGTTRDVMREYILLDDIPIHIIDTAGLRDSDDIVEREGIKRAWQEVQRADCILLVVDASNNNEEIEHLEREINQSVAHEVPIINVFNKVDKLKVSAKTEGNKVFLSAKSGDGLRLLIDVVKQVVGYQPNEGNFLARKRHIDSLTTAMQLLEDGLTALTVHRAGELLAEDLRLAHQALCEITGTFTSDDLLGRIFSSFCIGK